MSSAPQILRQADVLKVTVGDSSKNVGDTWVSRQKLEDLYKKLLLMDLEYALDKKVEQDLWNHAFKNQINILQTQAKDKQNPKRSEIQGSLNLFLETASGFYLQLLQLICTTFKLDLPFRRKSSIYGILKEKLPLKLKITPPKKSSCLYVCQHCLVHLGDIARYRQQVDQAQTYYWHAANLNPSNGQPYNQLAIVEVAKGNKLSTVFYYIRGLAVRHPFPVAATNLEKLYAKLAKDIPEFKGKLSVNEIVTTFLQFHALVHLCIDLPRAAALQEKLLSNLPAQLKAQSTLSQILIQIVAINLFAIHHSKHQSVDGSTESGHTNDADILSKDEEKCFDLVFTLLVSMIDIILQHVPKQEPMMREFFTMPAVKLLFDWLRLNPDYLGNPVVKNSNLWVNFSKLLNTAQLAPGIKDGTPDLSKYEEVPLPEDTELRCFQPIEKSHSGLSFSRLPVDGLPVDIENQLRCQRLISHGEWITEEHPGFNLLTVQPSKSGRLLFSAPNIPNRTVAGVVTTPGTERKRQNVAIQAIIQKQNQTAEDEDGGDNVQDPHGSESAGLVSTPGHTSPKYLLGVPTSEPLFYRPGSNRQASPSPASRPGSAIQIQQKHPAAQTPKPPGQQPQKPAGQQPQKQVGQQPQKQPSPQTAKQIGHQPPKVQTNQQLPKSANQQPPKVQTNPNQQPQKLANQQPLKVQTNPNQQPQKSANQQPPKVLTNPNQQSQKSANQQPQKTGVQLQQKPTSQPSQKQPVPQLHPKPQQPKQIQQPPKLTQSQKIQQQQQVLLQTQQHMQNQQQQLQQAQQQQQAQLQQTQQGQLPISMFAQQQNQVKFPPPQQGQKFPAQPVQKFVPHLGQQQQPQGQSSGFPHQGQAPGQMFSGQHPQILKHPTHQQAAAQQDQQQIQEQQAHMRIAQHSDFRSPPQMPANGSQPITSPQQVNPGFRGQTNMAGFPPRMPNLSPSQSAGVQPHQLPPFLLQQQIPQSQSDHFPVSNMSGSRDISQVSMATGQQQGVPPNMMAGSGHSPQNMANFPGGQPFLIGNRLANPMAVSEQTANLQHVRGQLPSNMGFSPAMERLPGKVQSQQMHPMQVAPANSGPGSFRNPFQGLAGPGFRFSSSVFGSPAEATPPPSGIRQGFPQDEMPPSTSELFGPFSQITIQPPKTVHEEFNPTHRSTFQGHAEGTPKPDHLLTPPISGVPILMGIESEVQSSPVTTSSTLPVTTQQGTYSLFSNSPWSVQIPSAGDAKSHSSSPFSSQESSMRNSPDSSSDVLSGDAKLAAAAYELGLRFGPVSLEEQWGHNGLGPAVESTSGSGPFFPGNMQSIWSASGPSPLERLLEMQKQQRQTDPH